MDNIEIGHRMLMLTAYGIILFLDLIIVVMGWFYRKKFDFIPPKFFGLMSGKFTESIVQKFGLGFTSNSLFMLPVFMMSMIWLYILATLAPSLIELVVGVLVGFHLTLLLLSMMKLSIVSVLEAKYGATFHPRAKKAIAVFLRGK